MILMLLPLRDIYLSHLLETEEAYNCLQPLECGRSNTEFSSESNETSKLSTGIFSDEDLKHLETAML